MTDMIADLCSWKRFQFPHWYEGGRCIRCGAEEVGVSIAGDAERMRYLTEAEESGRGLGAWTEFRDAAVERYKRQALGEEV